MSKKAKRTSVEPVVLAPPPPPPEEEMDVDEDLNMAEDEEGGTRIGDIYIPPPVQPYCSSESIGPRLIIHKIVNFDFKSYAGEVQLGPFCSVSRLGKFGMFYVLIRLRFHTALSSDHRAERFRQEQRYRLNAVCFWIPRQQDPMQETVRPASQIGQTRQHLPVPRLCALPAYRRQAGRNTRRVARLGVCHFSDRLQGQLVLLHDQR